MKSKFTSNLAIHHRDGWRQRMVFSVMALVMMLLVPIASLAANHDGNKVSFWFKGWNNYDPKPTGLRSVNNNKVKTIKYKFPGASSNTQLDLFLVQTNVDLTNNAWKDLEGYFAVSTVDQWLLNENGLVNSANGNRFLSIMKLVAGTKVTINFGNANLYFVDPTQVTDNGNNGSNVQSGTTYIMAKDGMLDLGVGNYARIDNIQIEYSQSQLILENRDRFNDIIVPDGTKDGMPYYNYRLASRWFPEPVITGIGCSITGYTVENYGNSLSGKDVAIAGETDGNFDLMFKNAGWCKVTANASNGSSVSYLVEAWDYEAYYTVEGNKYSFARNPELNDNLQGGVLKNRVVTAIPGIEVRFGIPVHDYYDYEHAFTGIPNNDPNQWTSHDNSDSHYQPNTTIVYNWPINNTDHFVSFTNDDNGWWDRYPNNGNTWPYQGTFYTFKATAKGKLKVGGIKVVKNSNQNGNVYLVNLNNVNNRPEIVPVNAPEGYYESQEIELNPGDSYALHGQAENGHWAPFLLEWFSYETEGGEFKLSNYYGVSALTGYEVSQTTNKTVTSLETVQPGSGYTTATVVAVKGTIDPNNLPTVTINGDGNLVFSNIKYTTSGEDKMGGAIKVKLEYGGSVKYYVMTIPYGKHVWDFRNTTVYSGETQATHAGTGGTDNFMKDEEALVADMWNNTDDWSRVYKVHTMTDRHYSYLATPILSARGSVIGNNAFYLSNTAGFVVEAGPESFGAHETKNTADGFSNMSLDEQYIQDASTTGGADQMWLHDTDARIIFPGVKAGQYIKVYCHRHSDGKGETYTAENLMDLSGKDITSNFIITGTQGDDRRLRGVIIFRVPTDYEPTNVISDIPALILKDNGWTRYMQIEITDEYSTDLRSYITEQIEDNITNTEAVGAGLPCNSKGSVVYKNSASVKFDGYTNTYIQNAWSPQFTVEMPEGSNVTYTLDYEKASHTSGNRTNYWHNLIINITGGSGNLHVIQEMVTGDDGYVLDRSEFWLAVSQYHPQTYPYTWDFTARNMSNPWTVEGFNKASTSDNTTPYARMSTTDGTQAYGRWDDGTNSNKIVHFVGQDYYNQYTSHRNINNRNGNANSFQDVAVSDADLFNHYDPEDEEHVSAQVIRPLVADGGELTYGSTTLKETVGLRFGMPRIGVDWNVSPADFAEGGKYEDYNNTLEFTADGLVITAPATAFDQTRNHQETTIYIPEVDPGMYIFVKATAKPVVANATEVNQYNPATGVYVFKKTAAKDVEVGLKFSSATVYKIGVTNIEKSINDIGYATESRDHAIDHTYTGEFTLNDVNAYGITIYGDNESPYNYKGYSEVHKSENEVTVIPAYTGVVLYKDETSAVATFPLFYPACNVVPSNADNEILKTNWMAPNVVSTTHSEETEIASAQNGLTGWNAEGIDCTKFVMTRYHFVYKKDSEGEGIDTEQGKVFEHDVEAFYRLRIDPDASKNVLGANKAYLLVPTASLEDPLWNGGTGGYVNMFYIDLADVEGFGDVEPTSIDSVQDVTYENNVYYTLTGIRLNGKPTVKGFYLCNGKKVYVK